MSFTGQVAVITGGGSGMGQAWARRLASGGATVAILDVNEAGMAETAAATQSIKPYTVDITDADAVAEVFADIETHLGPVDRVANARGNHAIWSPARGRSQAHNTRLWP